MIENNHVELWKRCLQIIRDNVPEKAYTYWFEPIVPVKYENKALTIGVPSIFFYEMLEDKYLNIMRKALNKGIEEGTQLKYKILADKTNQITVDPSPVVP